jgi:hypothetical protein
MTERRLKTGCGRSEFASECRLPPKPAGKDEIEVDPAQTNRRSQAAKLRAARE